MSEDQDNYKGFNKKHLKKAYDNKKKARRNKDEKLSSTNNIDIDDEEENLEENDSNNEIIKESKGLSLDVDDEEEIDEDPKYKKKILNSKNYTGSASDDEEEEYQGILSKKTSKNSTPKSTFSPSGSSSSIVSFGSSTSSNDFGFGNVIDFGFINGEDQLNNEIATEIHIHKVPRRNKANRFDTIIIGLFPLGKDRVKKILSQISSDLGVGGCIKKVKDMNEDPVLYISGDNTEKIKNILMKELGKSEEFFHTHSC